MNIMAVDDEPSALEALERSIRTAAPTAGLVCFDMPQQALIYAEANRIDAAFLDIEMGGMDGLALAKGLQGIYPGTNIIFVTGFRKYTGDALDLRVSGYVMKPINSKRIREELDNLRHSPEGESKPKLIEGVGQYTFDHASKRVFAGGKDLLLHPREYNILHLLASRPGVYFTPRELYEKTAGHGANGDVRALYSHISRLRKKLGLDNGGVEKDIEIEQRRGKGYRLVIHAKEQTLN